MKYDCTACGKKRQFGVKHECSPTPAAVEQGKEEEKYPDATHIFDQASPLLADREKEEFNASEGFGFDTTQEDLDAANSTIAALRERSCEYCKGNGAETNTELSAKVEALREALEKAPCHCETLLDTDCYRCSALIKLRSGEVEGK